MKLSTTLLRRILFLSLFLTSVGCASTRTHESTGQYVDDSVITTKVKSELAGNDFVKSFQIAVVTYKGAVQLSGFVDTQAASDKALQLASAVGGVGSVENDLIIK
jgi:hyperosmotically inducible protein